MDFIHLFSFYLADVCKMYKNSGLLITLVLAGFDNIKLFWCKFSHTIFKPDHFIAKEILALLL
jgi:hypothetical protein